MGEFWIGLDYAKETTKEVRERGPGEARAGLQLGHGRKERYASSAFPMAPMLTTVSLTVYSEIETIISPILWMRNLRLSSLPQVTTLGNEGSGI